MELFYQCLSRTLLHFRISFQLCRPITHLLWTSVITLMLIDLKWNPKTSNLLTERKLLQQDTTRCLCTISGWRKLIKLLITMSWIRTICSLPKFINKLAISTQSISSKTSWSSIIAGPAEFIWVFLTIAWRKIKINKQ